MRSSVDVAFDAEARYATLTLSGVVTRSDAVAATRVCLALPRTVRVLRVDARSVTLLETAAVPVLQELARRWTHPPADDIRLVLDQRALVLLTGVENANADERSTQRDRHGDRAIGADGRILMKNPRGTVTRRASPTTVTTILTVVGVCPHCGGTTSLMSERRTDA